jgi:hypothetical protein
MHCSGSAIDALYEKSIRTKWHQNELCFTFPIQKSPFNHTVFR